MKNAKNPCVPNNVCLSLYQTILKDALCRLLQDLNRWV